MFKRLAVTAALFHHLCTSHKISHSNFKELIVQRFRVPLPINKADFLESKLTTRWPSGNDLKEKFNLKYFSGRSLYKSFAPLVSVLMGLSES